MKTLLNLTLGFTLVTNIVLAQEGGGTQTVVADTVQPAKPSLTVSVETAFTNSYLWRGISFNQGLLLQPSINFEYSGFNFNIWNNSSIVETQSNAQIQELDFSLSKILEAGSFYFEPALLCYTYPSKNSLTVTAEASLFAGYYFGDFGIFINPSTDFIQNAGGAFSETGFTYDHETDNYHIVFNAGYGTGNKKFAVYNIFDDETVTPETIYQLIDFNGYVKKNLNEILYLKPAFNYCRIIGADYKNSLNTNQLNFTVSIGADF